MSFCTQTLILHTAIMSSVILRNSRLAGRHSFCKHLYSFCSKQFHLSHCTVMWHSTASSVRHIKANSCFFGTQDSNCLFERKHCPGFKLGDIFKKKCIANMKFLLFKMINILHMILFSWTLYIKKAIFMFQQRFTWDINKNRLKIWTFTLKDFWIIMKMFRID